MEATEDLFTPIHKALRSMIYSLGTRLQTNDFSDPAATSALTTDLENDFAIARSAGCILCVLSQHATDEEHSVFPAVAEFNAPLVESLIAEHHELGRREAGLIRDARALLALPSAAARVEAGIALNQSANDLFALYIAHMNREETHLVPLMRRQLTDGQMAAMRGAIMSAMPPDRLFAILRWMAPSLNVHELTNLIVGLKYSAPPEVLGQVSALCAAHVDHERWEIVRQRAAV